MSKSRFVLNINGKKVDYYDPKLIESKKWQWNVTRDVKEKVLEEKELRLQDIEWKLEKREEMKTFLTKLLVWQNSLVFTLVVLALFTDKIEGLELVFTTLVGGTILQTTAMIHIIMKWLFSEIPYKKI